MEKPSFTPRFSLLRRVVVATAVAAACLGFGGVSSAQTHASQRTWIKPQSVGALDCNGMSPVQATIETAKACTDIHGIAGSSSPYVDDGRFYDNGRYIGHDEPDTRFLSKMPRLREQRHLPGDAGQGPGAAPHGRVPGHDRTHWVELSVAPWFSMALCNQFSYPLMPCKPRSDAKRPQRERPRAAGRVPGRGEFVPRDAVLPAGMAPFIDNISCNNRAWCASLHINDLECTLNFASCNTNCEEPTNFAFIQTERRPDRAAEPAAREHRDQHAERAHAAHALGRPSRDPHLGCPGAWASG